MEYCNIWMFSMGAIILEDSNSKSQSWIYCPALQFMFLFELAIPPQLMENKYAKEKIISSWGNKSEGSENPQYSTHFCP